MSSGTDSTVTLRNEDDWWVARDCETGVSSQGRTREEAMENLSEALCGYGGEGKQPTAADLRKLGICPEKNEPSLLDESSIFE